MSFFRFQGPLQKHRGEPDTYATDTRTIQTNHLKANPTDRLTCQTTPEPRDLARVASSPQTKPLTRSSAVVVTEMATAPRRGWEQRGREPDGIGDGTPPRTGRRGGKRLRRPRERLITLTVFLPVM